MLSHGMGHPWGRAAAHSHMMIPVAAPVSDDAPTEQPPPADDYGYGAGGKQVRPNPVVLRGIYNYTARASFHS